MNEVAFVRSREPDWQRLTQLCDRAEVSPAKLSSDEFHEFVRVYRRVSADLATARTRSNNVALIEFLNDLVARGYGLLYRAPRRPFGDAIRIACETSARTVRACRWFVLMSAVLFVASAVFSFFLLDFVPDTRQVFVPPEFEETFAQWKSGKFEERPPETAFLATGMYMANNPLQAIRGGAIAASTFGLGTCDVLFFNGAIIGALAHEVRTTGQMPHLFTSIAPHGVTELSGLVLSGSAGFVMAFALIHPGRRRRGEALRAAGVQAMVLLATSVIMMFIAAPIEGFFSFNPQIPPIVKVLFALSSATAWALFWLFFGREDEGTDDSTVS